MRVASRFLVAMFLMLPTALCLAADKPAKPKEKPSTAELLKTFRSEFVEITPGKGDFPKSFEMGSDKGSPHEKPVHEVTFDYSFFIAKYEVPQNLYEAVLGQNPSKWKGPRNSVEMMTFAEAEEFCTRVTTLLREAKLIGETQVVRLPSEAEWEYCCRAGTKTHYSFGDEATTKEDKENAATHLSKYAWHTGNAAGNDPPVGALQPNGWGLYDVHGYLWEFTADAWHDTYEGSPADGSPRKSADKLAAHVMRSGSWKDRYEWLRSSARQKVPAQEKGDHIGFRCVLTEP